LRGTAGRKAMRFWDHLVIDLPATSKAKAPAVGDLRGFFD